ncbi:MAG: hypothetical protein ABF723_04005 [Lentilactobacillus hilgardii]|nr:hypothetical protein [Lentilactobacillus hilgardii]
MSWDSWSDLLFFLLVMGLGLFTGIGIGIEIGREDKSNERR